MPRVVTPIGLPALRPTDTPALRVAKVAEARPPSLADVVALVVATTFPVAAEGPVVPTPFPETAAVGQAVVAEAVVAVTVAVDPPAKMGLVPVAVVATVAVEGTSQATVPTVGLVVGPGPDAAYVAALVKEIPRQTAVVANVVDDVAQPYFLQPFFTVRFCSGSIRRNGCRSSFFWGKTQTKTRGRGRTDNGAVKGRATRTRVGSGSTTTRGCRTRATTRCTRGDFRWTGRCSSSNVRSTGSKSTTTCGCTCRTCGVTRTRTGTSNS